MTDKVQETGMSEADKSKPDAPIPLPDKTRTETQRSAADDTRAAVAAEYRAALDHRKGRPEDTTPEVTTRVAELRAEGHGPQRHLDPTHDQLRDRLGTVVTDPQTGTPVLDVRGFAKSTDHIDPMTGTTRDGATDQDHRCGPMSSRFDSPADYAEAEQYMRSLVRPDRLTPTATVEDVLGPGAADRITGYHHDPAGTGGYQKMDFTGGRIRAGYQLQPDGSYQLVTMYVDPARRAPQTGQAGTG